VSRLVVMGVSGVGKSTVAASLGALLGAPVVEGDGLHPPENVAKMRRGEPLDDADREPWLDAVGAVLAAMTEVVVTCSALRRSYRDRLRAAAPDAVFVHLTAPTEVLEERVRSRNGHYMPASLLGSQLAALEPLEPDEAGVVVDAMAPPQAVVLQVLHEGLPGSAV
jgi:carbohydrate kinase (thermoresistant glucokinase family)